MKAITTKQLPSPAYPDDDELLEFAAIGQAFMTHNVSDWGVDNTSKKKQCKKPDPRGYRKQFTFWLNGGHDLQLDMGNWLMDLKQRRHFAPTIRQALALYRELKEGRVDLLFELFPWVKDCLTPPPPASTDTQLAAAISQLAQVIQAVPVIAGQGAPRQNTGISPKPLATIPAPPPVPQGLPLVVDDDDDALVVTKDETAGAKSASNFLRSAFALNGLEYKS